MTNREFYTAIINSNITDTVIDFAETSLKKLDERNEKRKSAPSKTAIANEPIKKAILEVLSAEEVKTASEVASAVEISTQKASSLLRQLVENKKVVAHDIKVPKKGKCKGYTLAMVEA